MGDHYNEHSYLLMRYERIKAELAELDLYVRANGSSITVESPDGHTVFFICDSVAELSGWSTAAVRFADRSLKQYIKEATEAR